MTEEEWRAVAWEVRPDWTDEDFDQAWVDFLLWQHRKELH